MPARAVMTPGRRHEDDPGQCDGPDRARGLSPAAFCYRNGWLTGYSSPGQVAAARGFAVFYPNYRGSTGCGAQYLPDRSGADGMTTLLRHDGPETSRDYTASYGIEDELRGVVHVELLKDVRAVGVHGRRTHRQ